MPGDDMVATRNDAPVPDSVCSYQPGSDKGGIDREGEASILMPGQPQLCLHDGCGGKPSDSTLSLSNIHGGGQSLAETGLRSISSHGIV